MGVPSKNNTVILTFHFHPWALVVHQMKKLLKEKVTILVSLILVMVPLMKNGEIPKKFVAPLASPAFWPSFLGPWAENQNSAPNKYFASLSPFRKGMT